MEALPGKLRCVDNVSEVDPKPSVIYFIGLAVVVVGSLLTWSVLAISLTGSHAGTHDFISYWASGRQLLEHRNPYDPQTIFSLEVDAGYPRNYPVMMMRNAPNALFLTLPIGLMPSRVAYICWLLFLIGCLVTSVELLVDGDSYTRFLGYSFVPCLLCLVMGQTGIFPLLGLAMFLRFNEQRPYLAGSFLALCLIKPHLTAPLMVVIVAWAIYRRRYPVLYAMILAVVVCSVVPIYFDHAVWLDYARMIRSNGIENEFIPALGSALRTVLKLTAVWPQLIPTALASVWSLCHFIRHREHWSWEQRIPLLVLVSLAVAPYSWLTDQSIAFVAIALMKPKLDSLLLVIMSLSYIALLSSLHSHINMWLSMAWLGWYLARQIYQRQAMNVHEPPAKGAAIAIENV